MNSTKRINVLWVDTQVESNWEKWMRNRWFSSWLRTRNTLRVLNFELKDIILKSTTKTQNLRVQMTLYQIYTLLILKIYSNVCWMYNSITQLSVCKYNQQVNDTPIVHIIRASSFIYQKFLTSLSLTSFIYRLLKFKGAIASGDQ